MNCAKLFYLLWSLILLTYILTGCEKCDCPNQENNSYIEDSTDIEKASVIGIWQMQGTTKYELEFTNYGIVIWKHKPYMNSELNYTYSGTTLTISGIKGTGILSEDGNTLKISGFSDPSSFGTEGAKGPYVNGTYIRQ